ncbi:CHRD domain-containing protein [Methylobacterium radiotolerans]|uniref:CHRD domain-containing protein n=1 Tax=Methylobacterium radiotolerans TaxID=31998 RepID=UPI00097891EA|nr:CHRD domain-containing protein [Methylobacterium radiotolerans]ONF50552.1 CHRD domain-containing protein [Methylobacterium radiotolerans]
MTARMSHRRTTSMAVLLVLGLPLAAGPAVAAGKDVTYRAALNGGSEVPATASHGEGEVTATFDPATKRLSWSGRYSGLTGPVTAAHFHGPAKAGENAGVLVPVTAASSPFTGEATLDDVKAADLAAGKLYFNLHTAANPKGEIRGQLERAP